MFDAMSPRQFPQFYASPYLRRAMLALQPLRFAEGYEPRIEVIPDRANVAIAGKSQYEHRITLPPGSFLWAVAGTTEQPEGFSTQIMDLGTRRTIWSQHASFENVYPAGDATVPDVEGNPFTIPGRFSVLTKARAIVEPGLLQVQLRNLSDQSNKAQVLLYFFTPPEPGTAGNQYNRMLEEEIELARLMRAARTAGAEPGSSGAGPVDLPEIEADPTSQPARNHPFSVQTAGENVILPGASGRRIAVYQFHAYNAEEQTIRLLDGAGGTDLQGPLPDYPKSAAINLAYQNEPHFVLQDGRSLVAHLTAGSGSEATGPLAGFLKYRMLEKWEG